jgi:hypothetical protein
MFSHSRNSRKGTLVLKAVAVSLIGSAAHAADHFTLTAYSNSLSGDSLVHGNYALAIDQLTLDAHSFANASVDTNRCVALVVTRKFDEAKIACDNAVSVAQKELAGLPISQSYSRQDYRQYLASAYSNRAVLAYMMNDKVAAQVDLQKAEAAAPKDATVANNVTALQSHDAVAQVSIAQSKQR